jgi:hypothetical protein
MHLLYFHTQARRFLKSEPGYQKIKWDFYNKLVELSAIYEMPAETIIDFVTVINQGK